MCLIIHKPNKEAIIPDHILDNAELINPDGFGIVYTDTNQCIRTMDYNYARELILAERPFVAHYRYATRGNINKNNCHPYHVKNFIRLFSNGTVADLGDDNTCDTAVVAKYLNQSPVKCWDKLLSMTETRFAITYPDGHVSRHGVWHEKDGVFYSKNNCFHTHKSTIGYHYGYTKKNSTTKNNPMSDTQSVYSSSYDDIWYEDDYDLNDPWDTPSKDDNLWKDCNLLAVYGTLKAGRANHSLLQYASYVGAGQTVYKYGLQAKDSNSVPFVFEHINEHRIAVEVYEVSDANTQLQLDYLEGHPNNYARKQIDVELLDGSVKTCWLYFANPTWNNPNMEYLHTY